jgi:hypothetical protein
VPWRSAAVAALVSGAALAGCSGAITLTIAGDLPVPSGVDAICVGVADRDPAGGQFGRAYLLTGPLGALPQTLAVDPGSATSAFAWAQGYRGGVPVAFDQAAIDFGDDVTLRLDGCRRGRAGAAAVAAMDATPAARVVRSMGRGGTVAVAIGDSGGRVLQAQGGGLAAVATFADGGFGGAITDAVAFDADGDCDDDLAIATDAGPPHLWLRDGTAFTDAGPVGGTAARALAAADVDGDGDVDLILGGGASLVLLRNDGGGHFAADAAAFPGGAASDVTTLAAGDLDGDGRADLVVGQGATTAAPLVALLGNGAGFAIAPGVLPAVSVRAARATLVDADGDLDPDLALALADQPARLYVDRGGVLEDQSFVRLPQPAPVAGALAIADWDDDCAPDLALATAGGTQLARGGDGGAFTSDGSAPAASDAAFVDLDGDGVADLVTAGPSGVAWVKR